MAAYPMNGISGHMLNGLAALHVRVWAGAHHRLKFKFKLRCEFDSRQFAMSKEIRFFSRKADWAALSNFAPSPFEVDGLRWATVEHYFQAAKFLAPEWREHIRLSPSPQAAKTRGRSRAHAIHADWDIRRVDVMREALRHKFSLPEMRALLLSTGKRTLIEDSPYDNFWGSGRLGKGQNMLGCLLMALRSELLAAPSAEPAVNTPRC